MLYNVCDEICICNRCKLKWNSHCLNCIACNGKEYTFENSGYKKDCKDFIAKNWIIVDYEVLLSHMIYDCGEKILLNKPLNRINLERFKAILIQQIDLFDNNKYNYIYEDYINLTKKCIYNILDVNRILENFKNDIESNKIDLSFILKEIMNYIKLKE